MLMRYDTIREATEGWVREFNAINTGMIAELMQHNPCDWRICNDESYGVPMWGTMWSFYDSADDYWLEELDGVAIMIDIGFTVFESYNYGYFFGLDAAGFDFYEAFWIPLYKARGLCWHTRE